MLASKIENKVKYNFIDYKQPVNAIENDFRTASYLGHRYYKQNDFTIPPSQSIISPRYVFHQKEMRYDYASEHTSQYTPKYNFNTTNKARLNMNCSRPTFAKSMERRIFTSPPKPIRNGSTPARDYANRTQTNSDYVILNPMCGELSKYSGVVVDEGCYKYNRYEASDSLTINKYLLAKDPSLPILYYGNPIEIEWQLTDWLMIKTFAFSAPNIDLAEMAPHKPPKLPKRAHDDVANSDDTDNDSAEDFDIKDMLRSLSSKMDALNTAMSVVDNRLNVKMDGLETSLLKLVGDVKEDMEKKLSGLSVDVDKRIQDAIVSTNPSFCVMAMKKDGLSEADAVRKLWVVDNKGLIVKNRPNGGLKEYFSSFAHEHDPADTLAEAVEQIKPTILVDDAAIGGAFTPAILKRMAEFNDRPTIFALSNSTSKAECTAEDAYKYTSGKCVFGSGSPFPPVVYNGKTSFPALCDNRYIFPGVALAVIFAGASTIPEEVFLISAEKLAGMVTSADLDKGIIGSGRTKKAAE
ncbi:hypothetical protein HA402_004802 [Bradysia odoriphaga]|nr:hypothetical protein HA402_004802 [Bradysia odoriphaga]